MPNPEAQLQPLTIPPGVTPSSDETSFACPNFTSSIGIRFRNGRPEKKGGYTAIPFELGAALNGVPRSVYSTEIGGNVYTLIGTNTRLYALIGSVLTNITPFGATPVAAHASLTTDYVTLANNPITTTINSNIVQVADTNAARRQVNDIVTLAGSNATVGGITTAQTNKAQTVYSIGSGYWTFIASTNATSTATGGSNAVIAASGMVNCTVTNTLGAGDRVKFAGAANNIGGLTNAQINVEFVVRNLTGSGFDFMTAGTATSSSANGDGNGTEFYPPILPGLADEAFGQGYGEGKFGAGLYGTALVSGSSRTLPQIWFFDRFGDYIMMTPGNQGALYEWTGNTATAPVITANSPAAINYMFVSDNTVVTFGNNAENEITASDQGDRTVWSGTAQNQYFDAVQTGAGRFIGAIKLNGINLIFTEDQTYTFQQIGLPNVWACKKIADIGMISPFGGYAVNGVAYWIGKNNFYTWSGGNVSVMNSNIYPKSTSLGFGGSAPCSILKYVFQNLNYGQKSKCFAWFNQLFQELRFHYPSASANDPDSVACVNLLDSSWWPDKENRIAAELPATLLTYPRLTDVSGNLYQHEVGTDDNGSALPFSLTTNLRSAGKNEMLLSAFIPDSIQTGDTSVTIVAYQWPNSTVSRTSQTYSVVAGAGRIADGQEGRFWQYTIAGDELGQSWRMGQWGEELQQSGDGQ